MRNVNFKRAFEDLLYFISFILTMRNVNIGKLRTLPSGGEGFILTMRNVNDSI